MARRSERKGGGGEPVSALRHGRGKCCAVCFFSPTITHSSSLSSLSVLLADGAWEDEAADQAEDEDAGRGAASASSGEAERSGDGTDATLTKDNAADAPID